jgi:hypothetical protein
MGNLQKSTIFGRAKTMVSCQKMVNIRSFTWPGRVNQGKKPGFSLDIYIYKNPTKHRKHPTKSSH